MEASGILPSFAMLYSVLKDESKTEGIKCSVCKLSEVECTYKRYAQAICYVKKYFWSSFYSTTFSKAKTSIISSVTELEYGGPIDLSVNWTAF